MIPNSCWLLHRFCLYWIFSHFAKSTISWFHTLQINVLFIRFNFCRKEFFDPVFIFSLDLLVKFLREWLNFSSFSMCDLDGRILHNLHHLLQFSVNNVFFYLIFHLSKSCWNRINHATQWICVCVQEYLLVAFILILKDGESTLVGAKFLRRFIHLLGWFSRWFWLWFLPNSLLYSPQRSRSFVHFLLDWRWWAADLYALNI